MRIGLFHNRYIYRGGEDSVVDTEAEQLRGAGHEVHLYTVDNREKIGGSAVAKLKAGLNVAWNRETLSDVADFLKDHPIDVGHVHNFFPILSPSIYQALRDAGVPVVQTLHNYRLLCGNGTFVRSGGPCEECIGKGPWHAVRYGCYRGSRMQTAVWARMIATHRRQRTWETAVDAILTPSQFAKNKLIEGGLPESKMHVKPNPVMDPGNPNFGGEGAFYIGRLSTEKGVNLLLDAWRKLDGYPLTIAGDGPDAEALKKRGESLANVEFVGHVSRDKILERLRAARFLVQPSVCYETFGMAIAEGMACGTPAIASDPTAFSELIDHGTTGMLFPTGDAEALAEACRKLIVDADLAADMGRKARCRYEESLTPEAALYKLESIYESVCSNAPVVETV